MILHYLIEVVVNFVSGDLREKNMVRSGLEIVILISVYIHHLHVTVLSNVTSHIFSLIRV